MGSYGILNTNTHTAEKECDGSGAINPGRVFVDIFTFLFVFVFSKTSTMDMHYF